MSSTLSQLHTPVDEHFGPKELILIYYKNNFFRLHCTQAIMDMDDRGLKERF